MRRAAIWLVAATVIVGALGTYDAWRGDTYSWLQGDRSNESTRYPSPLLFTFTAIGLYIAHALVLAGMLDKRRIAHYSTYFEIAWKLAIQIAFSALFVGTLWLMLWLGAALFNLVRIDFLQHLLKEAWFAIPITAFSFAAAMHITDVRTAIVRGIRSLLLVLLSWVLPVTTLLVVGFLLTLPWTGLEPLWATRSATSVLLGTTAALVILINAAFQNGSIVPDISRLVRISIRVAALALVPLTVIAIYALSLRVGDYGWTTDRIIAAICLLIASCYAFGYAWAACRKAGSMAPVANVNIATAFIVLAVLLALFSPAADPARLSVNSQMARLAAGKINADNFDFDYLRFEGARYGLAALEQLKMHAHGSDATRIRQKAELALNRKHRWSPNETTVTPADIAANITVWPTTATLPASFLQQTWVNNRHSWNIPACLTKGTKPCNAYLIDFTNDGKAEILVVGTEQHTGAALMIQKEDGNWDAASELPHNIAGCASLHQQLQAGAFRLVEPPVKDLEIGGHRLEMSAPGKPDDFRCADTLPDVSK